MYTFPVFSVSETIHPLGLFANWRQSGQGIHPQTSSVFRCGAPVPVLNYDHLPSPLKPYCSFLSLSILINLRWKSLSAAHQMLFKLHVKQLPATTMASLADFIWRVLTKKAAALLDIKSSLKQLPLCPHLLISGGSKEEKKREDERDRLGLWVGVHCMLFLRFYQDLFSYHSGNDTV